MTVHVVVLCVGLGVSWDTRDQWQIKVGAIDAASLGPFVK